MQTTEVFLTAGEVTGSTTCCGAAVLVIRGNDNPYDHRTILLDDGLMYDGPGYEHVLKGDLLEPSYRWRQTHTLDELRVATTHPDLAKRPDSSELRNAEKLYLELPLAPGIAAIARALGITHPLDWPRICPECGNSNFRYMGGWWQSWAHIAGPAATDPDTWFDGYWWCFSCGCNPRMSRHGISAPLIYQRG